MSTTSAEVAMTLPFALDSTGNVSKSNSQTKIWQDRVRVVVGTTLTERIMRPEFGTRIPYNVFEGVTTVEKELFREINIAFSQFLFPLTLIDISVYSTTEEGQVTADVTYELPNKEISSTTVGLATLYGNYQPYEEYPWLQQ